MHKFSTSFLVALSGLLVFGIPRVSSAAAPRNLVELANMLANIFNSGATFLVLLAIIIYLGGITAFLIKRREGSKAGGLGKLILWGLAGVFVMVSIWGILRLLQGTLFNNAGSSSVGGSDPASLQFSQ